ncbi:MAG: alpha/beta hydrolase [Neisseriaceae bacterium]
MISTPYGPVETHLEGEGSPVLFIHGTGMNAVSNWSGLVKQLKSSTDWRYIRPNLPGSGHSLQLQEPLTLPVLESQMLSVLDELGIEKAHVIGFSLGASIALHLAGSCPHRFISVTSIGGFIDTQAPRMQALLQLWSQAATSQPPLAAPLLTLTSFSHSFLLGLDQDELRILTHSIEKAIDWKTFLYHLQLASSINIKSSLNGITQPTLLITGKEDQLIPYELANQLYHRIPQSKLVEVNTGHASMLEKPAELANLLVNFIKSK